MRIKKTSQTTPTLANVVNTYNTSTEDAYSCNYIENIINDLYYKAGDTFSAGGAVNSYAGLVTTSATVIRFSIPLPKRLDNISSITINNLNLTVRGINGYIPSADVDFKTYSNIASISYRIEDAKNILTVSLIGSNAWTKATNNTPVTVSANFINITFN